MSDYSNLLQILTTEHFVLQGARSTATAESSSRSTLYLTVLSATVVALSFTSQVSGGKNLLVVFTVLGLPVVFFLGLVTYMRVLQNGLEDFIYVQGMNRIRGAYAELAPESVRYFVLSTNDDVPGVRRSMGPHPSRWQGLFTSATMITVVNSVVGGVLVGVLLGGLMGVPNVAAGAVGTATGIAVLAAFRVHQRRGWARAGQAIPPLFPSPQSASR